MEDMRNVYGMLVGKLNLSDLKCRLFAVIGLNDKGTSIFIKEEKF
jgi:hypothetical protein